MLLPLPGRNLCYDLVGPESGPVVAFSHSLAADLGMWAEQVPALAAAGSARAGSTATHPRSPGAAGRHLLKKSYGLS